MTIRRVACTQVTQQVWDAIKVIRYQRQVPNRERIARYMLREHGVSEDKLIQELNNCVQDGFVRVAKKVKSERKSSVKDGKKSDRTSLEQDAYSIPKDGGSVEKDGYDWYCFECHEGRDVICCTTCYRVYHPRCAEEEELPEDGEKNTTFVCKICKICNMKDEGEGNTKVKRKEMNRLLNYACLRLAGRLPLPLLSRLEPSGAAYASDQSSTQGTEDASESDPDDSWRADHLVFKHVDLATMEEKTKRNEYARLEEFQADLQTIVHNVAIYYGGEHILSVIGRQMLLDCAYDLDEIRHCADCYRASNEMRGKRWFCQPCDPPHELVYAKQVSYPYWPAKVIRVTKDRYDVRFFGSQHERAVIDKAKIRPITASITTLQVKRTAAWNKAEEELKYHQKMLDEARNNTNVSMKGSQSSSDEGELPPNSESEADEDSKPPPKKKRKVTGRGRKAVKKKDVTKVEVKSETPEKETDSESSEPSERASVRSRSKSSRQSSIAKSEGLSQEDMVTSSCQEPRYRSVAVQAALREPKDVAGGKSGKKPSKAVLAKLEAKAEKEKQEAIAEALRLYEEEIQKEHQEQIKQMQEEHAAEISDVKLKQWCFNCEKEAIYHCCWNTAYCSVQCQQDHWITEHKPHCRRKR